MTETPPAGGRRNRPLPTWLLALVVPVVAAIAVGVTTLTAGDDGATSAGTGRPAAITIKSFTFSPNPVRIKAGAKVVIANRDGVEHTLTADDGSFDAGIIDRNGTATITVRAPGRYTFSCQIHPSMTGTLVAS